MDLSGAFRQLTRGISFKNGNNGLGSLKKKTKVMDFDNQNQEDHAETEASGIVDDLEVNSKPQSRIKRRNIERERINKLRKDNRVKIKGEDIPKPIESFARLQKYGLPDCVLQNIDKSGYQSPTSVQMEAIPLMLKRRELICCAPTGSGKTLAFLIPLIIHLKEPKNCGFRAVILAPTRELAKQIHRECLYVSDGTQLRVHLIKNVHLAKTMFGTDSQLKFDILVTTPKRLVFLLKTNPPSINIKNVEWLVIDECDKLFESSFRNQLSVIYKACSESSSCCRALFSATFDKELETWFQLNLDNVVTLVVGGKNRAASSVEQRLLFVGNEEGKVTALRGLIADGLETPVLIFVDKIDKAKRLYQDLVLDGTNVDIIHSERTQEQRDEVVRRFREGTVWFLICTELMGRGIDFKGVNLLVNYDLPKSVTAYIHRIGRTGRAGREGKAITFFTEKDIKCLGPIVSVMRKSNSQIPDFLLDLSSRKRKAELFKRKMVSKRRRITGKGKRTGMAEEQADDEHEVDSEQYDSG